MRTLFFKLSLPLFLLLGFFVFLNTAQALNYDCVCKDSVQLTVSASNSSAAHDSCEAACAGHCRAANDCGASFVDVSSGNCDPSRSNECDAGYICDAAQKMCVPISSSNCSDNRDCSPLTEYCDISMGGVCMPINEVSDSEGPSDCLQQCANAEDPELCESQCSGSGTSSGGSDCLQQCNGDEFCEQRCAGSGGGSSAGSGGATSYQGGKDMTLRVGNITLPNPLKSRSVGELITGIANFILTLAIPFAVLMIILAGFRFAVAQGEEEKIKTARRNLLWTVTGLAVVLASNLLIVYIQELLGYSSGSTFNTFFNQIKGIINLIITLLFGVVTIYFIWGIIQYVRSGGDEKMLEQGKRHMVWGIIGMAIMAAAWGIVGIIQQFVAP